MSGTHLYYNGILLRDCETKEFIQDIEYDESGTDPMYSRFRITVVSMLASVDPEGATNRQTQHPSAAIIPSAGTDAASSRNEAVDQLTIIQGRLQEAKKDFWLAVHGTRATTAVPANPTTSQTPFSGYRILLAATGEYSPQAFAPPEHIRGFSAADDGLQFTNAKRTEHIDCNNGPKPLQVSATLVGGRFIRVQFTIEVCLSICRGVPTGDIPPVRDARKVKGVISNRWSVVEDLDSNFCTTHNISGVLVISSHEYKAQGMRTMVHPGLFPYARLENRSFSVDPTGMKLAYQFSIKEIGNAPLPGLVDWDATYSESSAMGTANQFGTMSIKVRGSVKRPPGMTQQKQKQIMLRCMFAILQSRITGINTQWKALPGNNAEATILKECVVTESLKEPVMDMRVNVQHTGGQLNDFNLRLGNMGAPIPVADYDPLWWPMPDYFQFDTAAEDAEEEAKGWGGSYFDYYAQSPCNLWHSLPRGAKTDQIILAEEWEPETPGE